MGVRYAGYDAVQVANHVVVRHDVSVIEGRLLKTHKYKSCEMILKEGL